MATSKIATEAEETSAEDGKRRRILLATDGSRAAEKAGRFAARLACGMDAHFTVAAVAVEHGNPIMPWDDEPIEHTVPLREAETWSRALADRLRAEGHDVTQVVLRGHAAEALAAEAESLNVDFIVIGQHGRSDMPPHSSGSVAEALARSAPCPLLIVP
jgi:nucleotide-binding universal stress UspA family protein